jgi:uncharacterized protein YjbJ (UPF0337 family)
MDKDRIAGSARQIIGAIKETAGKIVGDAKLQLDGKADQAEGKGRDAIGTIKDLVKCRGGSRRRRLLPTVRAWRRASWHERTCRTAPLPARTAAPRPGGRDDRL